MSTSNLQFHFTTQTFDIKKIFIEFDKPFNKNLFYQNKSGLVLSADIIKFNIDKWDSNPMMFCEDYYSVQYLYPIILVCNTLGSIYDFILDNLRNGIVAPKLPEIIKVLSFQKI